MVRAAVAELLYAQDLKSCARKGLRVGLPPAAPHIKKDSLARKVPYEAVRHTRTRALPFGCAEFRVMANSVETDDARAILFPEESVFAA